MKTEELRDLGEAGIVAIRYVKICPEFVMIGMEYCPGGSLEQFTKNRNGETMEEKKIKSLVRQILPIMVNFSEKGIIHRNIKPENILIDANSNIKIADFGLAIETTGKYKLPRVVAGSFRYSSPELLDGSNQSPKSDIWALGAVVLELAYGRDAFKDSKIIALKAKKILTKFQKRGGYSREMAEFLSKCFEVKSENRATVEELQQNKWLTGVSIHSVDVIDVEVIRSGK